MISIVNYGMGNIRSVQNALHYLELEHRVVTSPGDVRSSTKLILPGVGAFGAAMANIRRLHLDEALRDAVGVRRVPLLGICLGMELFAERGEEDGLTDGFGWIRGTVRRFELTDPALKVPHIGFNRVTFGTEPDRAFRGLGASSDFYFVHAYHLVPAGAEQVIAWVDHGGAFPAAVRRGHILGTQFHPEKSQSNGLTVLRNFALDRN